MLLKIHIGPGDTDTQINTRTIVDTELPTDHLGLAVS